MAEPRTGLVFGASSGVGYAVAQLRAGRGDAVVGASRSGTTPTGVQLGLKCDVRDSSSVAAAFEATLEQLGTVDWIVNAAGVGYFAPIDEGYSDLWREILETNVVGLANVLSVIESSRGVQHVVQIGSLAAQRPSQTPGNSLYSASKAAGAALFAEHRSSLRRSGSLVKLSMITPGFIGGTRFVEDFFRHTPDLAVELLAEFEPLEAGDVARCADFVLDSPDNVEIGEIVVRPVAQPT